LLCVFFQQTWAEKLEDAPLAVPNLEALPDLKPVGDEPFFSPVVEVGLLRGLVEFPVYSFYLGSPDIYGVAYVPNFSPRVGAQLQWKDFGLTLTLALPIPKEEIDRRGQTDQLSFIFSRYWRQHGLDVYLQSYRGFYVASPLAEFRIHKPERNPQLPDAEITNVGLNYYQVLDPEHYSLMAAFNQMEMQLRSGGSALWTAFYNHLQMSRGQKFIKGTEPDALQEAPKLESGAFETLGLGWGYGYTWVISPIYVTVQGIAGAGAQYQNIDDEGGAIAEVTTAALKLNGNAAVGSNYKSYTFGEKILVDTLLSDIHGTHVYSTLLNGLLFFGARF
jgi:hypothetical protein